MDSIDRNILSCLATNGRMTNSNLAKKIGLSESATLERVRRLETQDIIKGYTLKINPAATDRNLEVIMAITLRNQKAIDTEKFINSINEFDEILSCAQVLGRFDFIAHVAIKDTQSFESFINKKLIPLGVIDRMESLTILNMVKPYTPPIPLNSTEI